MISLYCAFDNFIKNTMMSQKTKYKLNKNNIFKLFISMKFNFNIPFLWCH